MSIFFEPVNLKQWNMFEKVKASGHIEPFLAVNIMKQGDMLVLHIGSQLQSVASGIYAYGTIISDPFILRNYPTDYCNNKSTVNVRIDYIQKDKPIITHADCRKYINQFRSVHMVDETKAGVLWKIVSYHDGRTNNGYTVLNEQEREVAEQLLSVIKNNEGKITYSELSDRINSHPNPHTELPGILGKIGCLCYDLKLPFITFIVINKTSGIPGSGVKYFFDKYNIDIHGLDEKEVYKQERERIRSCGNWQRMADYLKLNIQMPVNSELIYPDELPGQTKYQEGTVKSVKVNMCERNPTLRKKCIEYYEKKDGKIKCQICGFDFGEFYGPEYSNMIHVHHTKPISKLKGIHEVDPIRDLIPVCPNCHMALHSSVGDGIDELKEKIRQNSNKID